MANVARISGFQPPKAISTAEGAKALRLLSSYPAWGERNLNEARRWISPAVKAALPARMQEAEAMLQAAIVADAKLYVGPVLAFVAPTSMTAVDQTTWFAAALNQLSGIPADLLREACECWAMKLVYRCSC